MVAGGVFLAVLAVQPKPVVVHVWDAGDKGKKAAICSASFVAKNILLTAKHCLKDWPAVALLRDSAYGKNQFKMSSAEPVGIDTGVVYGKECVDANALKGEAYSSPLGLKIQLWNGESVSIANLSTDAACSKYSNYDPNAGHICLRATTAKPLEGGTSGSPLMSGDKIVGVFVAVANGDDVVAVKFTQQGFKNLKSSLLKAKDCSK